MYPTRQKVRHKATLRVPYLHHLYTISANLKLSRPITRCETLNRDTMLETSDHELAQWRRAKRTSNSQAPQRLQEMVLEETSKMCSRRVSPLGCGSSSASTGCSEPV
ncbi:hypothetical protein JAAARDRAFT_36888 [Jaapia argillacea MUCL 33604]|uniref:Uncharacterized protein n=1 Tax=Jaapia argillacea MUCL 33604 TaxID=933084 RepID=A0A067PQK9_9AGAM|nr:hypothetical protein JAAARDRAFT_36888 [Jaapia argillacea MUCL 33604]